jgi:hypothetical protein
MKVFVVNQNGDPLMPTKPQKARKLLKSGKARIAGHNPFTIQLLHGSSGYVQPVTLGLDTGYQTIGYSAVTEKYELIGGEFRMLQGVSERLKERRMYRRNRRNRKRFRAPRFDNRRRPSGWLTPSIQHKFDTHIKFVEKIKSILPITDIIIEVANFDIQKIKNPDIEGVGYQQGEQAGFWNLREYILHRDGHKCQNLDCKNKAKAKILEVHHIGYWMRDRTDRPGNLITLCIRCHTTKNHKPGGFLYGWKPKVKSFKAETFMSTIRWRVVNELMANHIYGWQTKNVRIALELPKSHHNDAFVIAGGISQNRAENTDFEQLRRNNRGLERFYDAKYIDIRNGEKTPGAKLDCGRRTRNKESTKNQKNSKQFRGAKVSKGRRQIRRRRYSFQPNDLVFYRGNVHRSRGTFSYGRYILLDGLPKAVKTSDIVSARWRNGISMVIR